MANPAIQDADTKTGGGASAGSFTITYPTNLAAGDLILLYAATGGPSTVSAPGFTVILNRQSCNVLAKIADGTETGTFTLSLGTNRTTQWRCLRITNFWGGTLSAGTNSNSSDGIEATTSPETSTTSPNPPLVTPGWGSADDLILAFASGAASGTTVSAYPASYSSGATDNANTFLASARRNVTASSENPGAFTISANTNATTGVAATIAIRPGQSASATPGVASLSLTTFAPVARLPQLVTPPTKALSLTTFAPVANLGARVVPPTTAMVLTRFAPTVTATSHPGFVFTNVTRGASFALHYSTLTLSDQRPCHLATLSGSLDDRDAAVTIGDEDEIRLQHVYDEGSGPVTIFAGDITKRVRTDHGGSQGPRVYRFTAQDFHARLADNIITSSRDVTESVTARVAWIMGWSNRGLTTSHVQSISTLVGPFDYTGMSVLAALNQVAQLVAATLYTDYSKDLHFFTGTEANPAPFDLTRPASPPTSYPYRDFSLATSTPDLAHAVFVQGDGVSVWRTAVGAPVDSTRQERSIHDQTIKTLADAQALGDAMLAKWSAAAVEGQLATYRPGLQGGMTARISNPAWGTDATYVITSVTMSLLGPTLPKYQVGFADHYACKPGQAAFNEATTNAPSRVVNDVLQVIGDVSAAGANTVPNSSFESSGDWTVGSLWSAAYASANPFQGSKTARCAPTGTDAGELISAAFIAVDRTQDWWFSFQSYLSSRTSGTARCVVREYNGAGTLLASTNIDMTAAETAWTRHSVHFGPTATDSRLAFNASTTKVKIVFLTTGSATLTWEVDAVQFERSAQLTSYAPAPYEIADNTVGTSKIVAGAIVTSSLAAGAVIALVTNTGSTVVIDASGIAVTNGAMTVTNPGSVVIIDGTSDILRVAAKGTQSVSIIAGANGSVTTLSGLGTLTQSPLCILTHSSGNTAASEQAMFWIGTYTTSAWSASSSGGATTTRRLADSSRIYGTFGLIASPGNAAVTIYTDSTAAGGTGYQTYYVLAQKTI